MEDTENSLLPAQAAMESSVGRQNLNGDPHNVKSEQLAMEYCMNSFGVINGSELSELDLLSSSCGCHIPGTPDGGFTDSNGHLRLVQVVRVPLLPGMDTDECGEVLFDTVLTKIVKSQAWMKQTGVLPYDFNIFCWLPAAASCEACITEGDTSLWTEALMWNVRDGGWPFSLTVKVAPDPEGMFPIHFGATIKRHERNYWDILCFHLNPADFPETHEEDPIEWFLFDNDEEEDLTLHTTATGAGLSAEMLAVVKLAIDTIEYALQVGGEPKMLPATPPATWTGCAMLSSATGFAFAEGTDGSVEEFSAKDRAIKQPRMPTPRIDGKPLCWDDINSKKPALFPKGDHQWVPLSGTDFSQEAPTIQFPNGKPGVRQHISRCALLEDRPQPYQQWPAPGRQPMCCA